MKRLLSLTILALNMACITQAQAAACSADKLQEILQPATKSNQSVLVDCSLTLPKKARVSKQLLFAGQPASNTVLDCNGAVIEASYTTPGILITSVLKNGGWDVPQNIQIKNCTIKDSLRIHGMAANGQGEYLRESSLSEGHTKRAQQAAPHNIVLDNLTIESARNMLYLAPGVQYVTLKNSRFNGSTNGLAIYMDAESGNNTIENNVFNVKTKVRELVAVDGSANNLIRGNTFKQTNHGVIYLYRNCGEGGTIRHQTPSNNQIISNRFEVGEMGKSAVIWLGSRKGKNRHCDEDRGYSLGSSINDSDFAQNNTVADNTFVQKNAASSLFRMADRAGKQDVDNQEKLVRMDASPNQVMRNKVVD